MTGAAEGTFVRELAVDFPAHTSRLDSAAQAMAAGLPDLRFAHPAIPFIGAATGAAVPGGTGFAGYWRHNLRTAVRFDAAVHTAVDLGARTFVELSAHPALLMALNELTEDTPQTVLTLCSGRRDTDPMDELAGQIGAAAVADRGVAAAEQRVREANPRLPESFTPHLTAHASRAVEGGYVWKYDWWVNGRTSMEIRREELPRFWEAIECPVLLLFARETRVAQRTDAGDFIRGSRTQYIEDAGHWLHVDNPDGLLALLDRAFRGPG